MRGLRARYQLLGGRRGIAAHPPSGMGCTNSHPEQLAETLVTGCHQDHGTSLTPSMLRGQPGHGQRGKRPGFAPSAEAAAVEASPAFSSSSSSSSSPSSPSVGHTPLTFRVRRWHGLAGCQGAARHSTPGHGTAHQGTPELHTGAAGSQQPGRRLSPFPWTSGPFSQPLDRGWETPTPGGFGSCCSLRPAGMLTSSCPQLNQDEELPMGCEEPAGEGQRAWEEAPAAAMEEPCRLVLSTPSSILQDREIDELGPELPPRLTQQPWHLLYSTGRDGFSLRTLYRSGGQPDSPALLLIRDTEKQAFGAFSACAIRCSSGFYGTGETFLFSFCPELKVFRWTGRNNFFLKGDVNLLMVGAGGGRIGLWLDGDLHHGGSHPCETFDNETLSHQEEFCIQDLELWCLA